MRSSALLQTESKHLEAFDPVFKKEAGASTKSTDIGDYGSLRGVGHSFGKVKVNNSGSFPSNSVRIQAKLMINQPGDVYEQEADAIADRVMRMSQHIQFENSDSSTIQRKCAHCEEDEKKEVSIMQKAERSGGFEAPTELASQIYSTKGRGNPLPNKTRSFMENAFHTDFYKVRIHTDGKAVEMNQAINAKAFTHGNDIYFNRGQYEPGSKSMFKNFLLH